MTIAEARERGIARLRRPEWISAHIELYLLRGDGRGQWGECPAGTGDTMSGPWVRLYDPPAMLALGRPEMDYDMILWPMVTDNDYEPWEAGDA